MIIKHLSHSGFVVEDEKNVFIFDATRPIDLPNQGKNIYLFASHSHRDHFSLEAMENLSQKEKVHFILSADISQKIFKSKLAFLFFLKPYETITIDGVDISTYGSTDLGNSYLVSVNGKSYFHSGDLNWWHWEKRMTPTQLKNEELNFKKEVDLLKGKSIDFAFIPVDPRLEEYAYLAMNYFIKTVNFKYIIPMHSFGQYGFYKDLESHLDLGGTTLLNVERENQILYNEK